MIIATLIFFLITLLVILYPLLMPIDPQQPRIEATYKKIYQENKQLLEIQKQNQTVSDAEFHEQSTLLDRSLLASLNPKKTRLARPVRPLLVLTALLISVISCSSYWIYQYHEKIRAYDTYRIALQADLTDWLSRIPDEELDHLKELSLITPAPPNRVENYYRYAFPALSYLSAQTNHTDIRMLKLLALMYLNVEENQLAYSVYQRLYKLAPHDFAINANLLQFELAVNGNKLTPKTERWFEMLIEAYPQKTMLYPLYATLLFEQGKVEKSLTQWKALSALYADDEELKAHYEAVQSVIARIESGSFETNRARILEITLEKPTEIILSELPESVTLSLILVDHDGTQPIAATRIPLTQDTIFPLVLSLTDFDRTNPAGKFIKDYDHLIVFARVTTGTNGNITELLYETEPMELNKGAYKAVLTLRHPTENTYNIMNYKPETVSTEHQSPEAKPDIQ